MWKHISRIGGGAVVAAAFAVALLVTDIPAALEQADKSFAFIAQSLGFSNPPVDFVSQAWGQPGVVLSVFAVVFAIGVLLSWGIEKLWLRFAKYPPAPAIPAIDHYPLPSLADAFDRGMKDREVRALQERNRLDREEREERQRIAELPTWQEQRFANLTLAAKLLGTYDMPLRDVARHVAFESVWAIRYDRGNAMALVRGHGELTSYKWQRDLKAEMLRKFVDLRSRGTRQEFGEKPDNGPSPIPLDFWQRADFEVVDLLASELATIAFIPEKLVYREVMFDRADIERLWPTRSKAAIKARSSPFVEWVEPYRREADFNASFNESAWGNIA